MAKERDSESVSSVPLMTSQLSADPTTSQTAPIHPTSSFEDPHEHRTDSTLDMESMQPDDGRADEIKSLQVKVEHIRRSLWYEATN